MKNKVLILRNTLYKKDGTFDPVLSKLKNFLHKKGVEVVCATYNDISIEILANRVVMDVHNSKLESFSLIYFRRIGVFGHIAASVALYAQKKRIPFIDTYALYDTTTSKIRQTVNLALCGVPVPNSFYLSAYSHSWIKNVERYVKYPLILKDDKSDRGENIFLAKCHEDVENIYKKYKDAYYIIQEYIPNEFDYRILVLGKKIACAEKRIRVNKTEFRNNVHLGAREEFISIKDISKIIKTTAQNAARIANIQVAGVDILVDSNNNPYVLEVNSTPEFTLNQKISQEISVLTNYLIKCANKKRI